MTEQQNLSGVLENIVDGSAPNLNINNTLDMVAPHQRIDVLTRFCKKIKYNGYIELCGNDISELSRAFNRGDINLDEINRYLYHNIGESTVDVNYKASVSNLDTVCNQLSSLGFTIILKRRNKYLYYIKAQRSAPR